MQFFYEINKYSFIHILFLDFHQKSIIDFILNIESNRSRPANVKIELETNPNWKQ